MATKTFMGEPILKSILSRLIEISDARVILYRICSDNITRRDMAVDKDTTMSNFKVVLAKQKMLISFMTSYSYIVQQLSQCPSENAMTVWILHKLGIAFLPAGDDGNPQLPQVL